jgi:tetratricopeptide (TPR) repeat protein
VRRAFALVLLAAACLAADDWTDAKRQYSLGNFDEAAGMYERIAGSTPSQQEAAQAWIYAAWTRFAAGQADAVREAFRRALAAWPDVTVDADLFNAAFAGEFSAVRGELAPVLLPEQAGSLQIAMQALSEQYLTGKYKECAAAAGQLLQGGQRFRQIYKVQGDCLVAMNKLSDAYESYAAAGRVPSFVAPGQAELSPDAKLRKARSLYRRGEKKQAQALLAQLAFGVTPPPEVFSLLGLILLEQGQWFEAEKVFQQGLILHSGDAAYYNLYGVSLLAQEKAADSVRLFQQAVAQDRLFPAALANLAAAYARLKETSTAETYYAQAVLLDPTNASLLTDFGRTLFLNGKAAEAVSRLNDAVRFASDPVPVLYLRGLAHFALGRRAEANADLDAFLRARPDATDARESYGLLLRSQGQCADAVAYLGKAASVAGRRAQAQCLLSLGRGDEAEAVLASLPGDDMAVLNDRAAVLVLSGKFREAREVVAAVPASRRVTTVLETCETVEGINAALDAFGMP